MTKRANSDLEQQVSFKVTRNADAAFLFVDELGEKKASLVAALHAAGLRVTTSADELVVSRSGGQVDTLALAATLRERGCTTAVIVPVTREASGSDPVCEMTESIQTRLGSLTIKLVPAVVAFDGRPLPLTRTEELVLARLWAARGRTVAPEELAAAVSPGDLSVKALRVHLSKLRPKLAAIGLVVETLKRRGYRLSVVPEDQAASKVVRERPASPYRRAGAALFIPRAGTLHSTARRHARRARSESPWWLAPAPLEPSRGARPA
jgi:DNA-binding response OmpR family regulator